MPSEFTSKRILRWLHKGGFAVLDQALFSLSNFLASLLLARWLPLAKYGAFAVAYSVFLLLGAFHTAILTEPMLVFGSGKYADRFQKYLGCLLYGHVAMTFIISVILAAIAVVFKWFGSPLLAQAFFGLAVASPFILLLWILRRAYYVEFQPHWSALGGMLYMVLMAGGMYFLFRKGALSSYSGFIAMGAASLVVSFCFLLSLRPQIWLGKISLILSSVVADHWNYGRWSSLATLFMWLPNNIYYILLPIWTGLAGSAALRAAMNITMPILQTNVSIATLLVPRFVKKLKAHGKKGLHQFVQFAFIPFIGGPLLYWIFVVLFGQQAMNLLYGHKYAEHGHLLVLLSLLPISIGFISVFASGLRAMERPDSIFLGYLFSSFVALILGFWLLPTLKEMGAVIGLLASSIITAITVGWAYGSQIGRRRGKGTIISEASTQNV